MTAFMFMIVSEEIVNRFGARKHDLFKLYRAWENPSQMLKPTYSECQ